MDVSQLKRDRSVVLKDWKQMGDAVVTTSGCKIYAPSRFISRGLGEIGANTRIFGFFGIVIDDRYAVLNANTMISTRPSSTSVVQIDGTDYYEFNYEPGATVIANRNTVMQDTLVYYISDELIAKAKIPWYASFEDIAKIFVTANRYAGAGIIDSNVVIEMIVSQIVRVAEEKTNLYRAIVKDIRNAPRDQYAIVPLRSPIYGATNTASRLIGSHFDSSLMTSINNPSEKVEPVEALLRH